MSKVAGVATTKSPRRRRPALGSAHKCGVSVSIIGKDSKQALSTPELIAQVREGLPYTELEVLQQSLGVPMESLAAKVGLSRATLQRRKKNAGTLNAIQSDRLVRLARLVGKAVDVLGSEADARQWLTSAQRGLGGAAPLDYADTEVGAREVENLLGRIEHGVFS